MPKKDQNRKSPPETDDPDQTLSRQPVAQQQKKMDQMHASQIRDLNSRGPGIQGKSQGAGTHRQKCCPALGTTARGVKARKGSQCPDGRQRLTSPVDSRARAARNAKEPEILPSPIICRA